VACGDLLTTYIGAEMFPRHGPCFSPRIFVIRAARRTYVALWLGRPRGKQRDLRPSSLLHVQRRLNDIEKDFDEVLLAVSLIRRRVA